MRFNLLLICMTALSCGAQAQSSTSWMDKRFACVVESSAFLRPATKEVGVWTNNPRSFLLEQTRCAKVDWGICGDLSASVVVRTEGLARGAGKAEVPWGPKLLYDPAFMGFTNSDGESLVLLPDNEFSFVSPGYVDSDNSFAWFSVSGTCHEITD
mgnify:CR=1 FL=1